ncbi:MAG: hypothetical protein JRG73_05570 [Deltaproteobacteria bacterium]|nr:hypothetical protein [Deltaproteobacteria bacterium]MBW2306389.1 hypothetical protein [Deltaproteobacteria bacterium]
MAEITRLLCMVDIAHPADPGDFVAEEGYKPALGLSFRAKINSVPY